MNIKEFFNTNKRIILTTVIIGEVVIDGYLWCRSGLKISKILEKKKEEKDLCDQNDKEALQVVRMETIKEVAPKVIVPTIFTAVTIGTIIFSHKINTRDILLLSSVASFNKDKLLETKNKMYEVLGEKKAKEIESLVSKDKVEKDNQEIDLSQYKAEVGDVLCKDEYSGRYFPSNAIKVKEALLDIGEQLKNEMFVPLNELYSRLEIDEIPLGDDIGFAIENTMNGRIPVSFTTVKKDDIPCLVIQYDVVVRDKLPMVIRS